MAVEKIEIKFKLKKREKIVYVKKDGIQNHS